jgi:hypothetical protein
MFAFHHKRLYRVTNYVLKFLRMTFYSMPFTTADLENVFIRAKIQRANVPISKISKT